jgi:ribosomal protein S18 acetylase RimI-like enzyme
MRKIRPIIQSEKDNTFWLQLLDELRILNMGTLELIFPTELNNHYFSWFHKIEDKGFRRELQYSFEELTKTLENPELVFWFITEDGEPQILLFGYSIPDEPQKSFYLDTFAVKTRGKGIGNIVIEFLIRWAQRKKYRSIVLDTEYKDEKGIPLQQFYAKHGFETVSTSKRGALIMQHLL